MGKLVKIFLYIISGFVLLVTIGAISLLLFLDPNHYKQEISDRFFAKTGCKMQINGDISWSFFPSVTLQVNDVVIQNPPKYPESKPLATMGNVAFSVKLMPLFDHHIETKNIKLSNIEINVIQKAPKQQNLASLIDNFRTNKQTTAASTTKKAKPATTTNMTKTNDNLKLTVNNIAIHNARVNWDNLQNQKRNTVLIDMLQGNDINFDGNAFPLALNMTIKTADDKVTAQVKFSSNVQINIAQQRFKLNVMKAKSHLSGPGIPNQKMSLSLDSTIGYDFNSTQLAISDLTAALNNLTTQGALNGKIDGLTFQGDLNANKFDALKFLQSLGFKITVPDPAILQNASMSTAFTIDPKKINITTLKVGLNNTTNLTGDLQINVQTPKVLGNLNIDTLNLDQLLPLEVTKHTTTEVVNIDTTPQTTEPSQPVAKITQPITKKTEQLMAINAAEITLKIGSFTYQKLKLSNIMSKLMLKNQVLSFGFSDAGFYDGKISGMNTVKLATQPTQISVNEILQNVSLKPLLIDLLGINLLEGTAMMSIDVQGQGNTVTAITPTLSGNAKVTVTNGELDMLDALYLLDFAVAKYDNIKLPSAPRKRITKFQTINGSFTINNGIAKTKDLMLASTELNASGKGKIDMVQKKLDFRVDLQYTGNQKKILELQEKVGGTIPVIINGSFGNIKTDVDYPLLLRRAAAVRLGKTAEKAGGKIEKHIEKLGDEFNKQLNNIGDKLQNFLQ